MNSCLDERQSQGVTGESACIGRLAAIPCLFPLEDAIGFRAGDDHVYPYVSIHPGAGLPVVEAQTTTEIEARDFVFQGLELEVTTDLEHAAYRAFDPTVGVWMTEEPMRFVAPEPSC